jgi:hypothetical protein
MNLMVVNNNVTFANNVSLFDNAANSLQNAMGQISCY